MDGHDPSREGERLTPETERKLLDESHATTLRPLSGILRTAFSEIKLSMWSVRSTKWTLRAKCGESAWVGKAGSEEVREEEGK